MYYFLFLKLSLLTFLVLSLCCESVNWLKLCIGCENYVECLQNQKCDNCKEGYATTAYMTGDDTYYVCSKVVDEGCFFTDESSGEPRCLKCFQFYTLNPFTYKCIRCEPEKCLYCDTPNHCTACERGLVPVSNGTECSAPIPGCKVPVNGWCEGCFDGYQLINFASCVPCQVANCKRCFGANQCAECVSNSFVLSTDLNCITPVPNCAKATGSRVCVECSPGFQLTAEGQCMECSVQNCRECTTPSTCSICDAGYILSSGKCITCNVDHCLKCSDTDICKDCSDGYGLVGTTGKCGPCADSDCYQCALDASACTLFRKGIEAAKKQESISWWVWLIVAVVVTVALGVVAFFLFLYLSRKPIAPVTVYEVDCYDSDKGTEDEADSVVAAFHNRSFFARPPPIYLVYHYVRPRVITQDTVEIHGDLESVSGADITSSSEAGESKSQTSDCDISER